MLTKFSPNQPQEIKEYFYKNGYVIVENLLQEELVDKFLREYKKFKFIPFRTFRSQDTNRAELTITNDQGFLVHSILNPMNDVPFASKFSSAVRNCITSNSINEVLKYISGKDVHILWQNMFFDKSTGTVAHQDHYYLDTEPSGHLIAAWFALEDIHPDAGCFFVAPGSHLKEVVENKPGVEKFGDHEEFVTQTQDLIKKNNYQFKPCTLKKGDVLFWHPFTVHGAFKNKDPKYSRKSFTAHYLPEGYQHRHHPQLPETIALDNTNIRVMKSTQYQITSRKWQIRRMYQLYQEYLNHWIKQSSPKVEMRVTKY